MAKNHSEKQTNILSKNSFLNMYVFQNPNKKNLRTQESEEFCDCLIHMGGKDVVIQIKQNDKSNSKNWFNRKVLGDARRQLTNSIDAIISSDFEIWDRRNKHLISKCSQIPSNISPVVVFEKKDSISYQQVALSEKINGKDYICCNIFSIDDFKYATSMIPTGFDFINYLNFRFNRLKNLKPGIQLYPLFYIAPSFFKVNASTNEEILVAEFLSQISININEIIKNAKMWHKNLCGFEIEKCDSLFLQLMSYLKISDILKWDDQYKELIKKSKEQAIVWFSEPILIISVKDKKYGVCMSYFPAKNPSSNITDLEIQADARIAIKKYNLEYNFIFQYSNGDKVRLVKIPKQA